MSWILRKEKHICIISLALFHTHTHPPHTVLNSECQKLSEQTHGMSLASAEGLLPTASPDLRNHTIKTLFSFPSFSAYRSQDFREMRNNYSAEDVINITESDALWDFFPNHRGKQVRHMYLHGSLTFTFETEQCLSVDDSGEAWNHWSSKSSWTLLNTDYIPGTPLHHTLWSSEKSLLPVIDKKTGHLYG